MKHEARYDLCGRWARKQLSRLPREANMQLSRDPGGRDFLSGTRHHRWVGINPYEPSWWRSLSQADQK
jgi:hypothetical protein